MATASIASLASKIVPKLIEQHQKEEKEKPSEKCGGGKHPKIKPKSTLVNKSAFVDAKFGNDERGRLEDSSRPFKTIDKALCAISSHSKNANSWQVLVSPGIYPETVTIPKGINVKGSGPKETIISKLKIYGESTVSGLSIVPLELPAIEVVLSSEDTSTSSTTGEGVHAGVIGENGIVEINNCWLDVVDLPLPIEPSATQSVGDLVVIKATQKSGINGQVIINGCSISANLSKIMSATSNQLFQATGIIMQINGSNLLLTANSNTAVSLVKGIASRINIFGGSTNITISDNAPTKNVLFFDAGDSSFITIRCHNSYILEAILGASQLSSFIGQKIAGGLGAMKPISGLAAHTDSTGSAGSTDSDISAIDDSPATGFVIYLNAESLSTISVNDSIIDFQSVQALTAVLSNVVDDGSNITILDLKTQFGFVPRIMGKVKRTEYFAISSQGNLVSSGGLYTNIVNVNNNSVGGAGEYYVQDNNNTIIVDDPVVTIILENPVVVSKEVIYKGKVAIIFNASKSNVEVTGLLFGCDKEIIQPGHSILFQNNGIIWYPLLRC